MLLPLPIFGVIARHAGARDWLTPSALYPMVQAWTGSSNGEDWWIDRLAGLALFRPQIGLAPAEAPSEPAVLCVRGSVRASGRTEPPVGWALPPASNATEKVLFDLLEREAEAISALRGHFVLALWDGRRRRLLMARDPLGGRSMFLRTTPHLHLFCSELAPLLRLPQAAAELDIESACWYLAFGTSAPGRTLERHTRRLPAAHVWRWRPGESIDEGRYWTPLADDAPRQATPAVLNGIRDRLDRAIAAVAADGEEPRQGVLLSGGVDSTYVAATLASLPGPRPATYCVHFEEGLQANEQEYAVAVAEWLGIPCRLVQVTAERAADILNEVVLCAAEPCAAWATISHVALLSAISGDGIARLVSGLGADEVFGGYDHYRLYLARLLRWTARNPPPPGLDGLEAALQSETQAARRNLYPGVARFFDDRALRTRLVSPFDRWHYASHLRAFYRECRRIKPEADTIETMVAYECQFRIPDLLMANFEPLARRVALTVHYPFLDPDLVRLVTGLDAASRYRTSRGQFSIDRHALEPAFKWAMMQVARTRVPHAILDRPRKSFTAPFAIWMRNASFARSVLERLRPSRIWEAGLLRQGTLDDILDHLELGPGPHAFQLWAVLTLAAWFDRFVAGVSQE